MGPTNSGGSGGGGDGGYSGPVNAYGAPIKIRGFQDAHNAGAQPTRNGVNVATGEILPEKQALMEFDQEQAPYMEPER